MAKDALKADWNYPTRISVGSGRVSELSAICQSLNIKAPLLVTDPGLHRLPMTANVLEDCSQKGLAVEVFSSIKSNPTLENVVDGVGVYRSGNHDGIIAFGGGSALDAAKAIAFIQGQEASLWDFEDRGDNWKMAKAEAIAPVIAIPTTAGTGSEVGRASVITDPAHEIKKVIFHPDMMPKWVILDPELSINLPPAITAATGMDALSHNLEAYCAPSYHPMAEGIALEGIALIKNYLPQAFRDGQHRMARTQMLVASSMGATAFQRGLGAMHALSHPLGALYDAHHGRLNAILMPYVVQANRRLIEEKICRLADYLHIKGGFDGFVQWLVDLRSELGIEHALGELGIDDHQVPRLAKMATEDAAALTNPIIFSEQQYQAILYAALEGRMDFL